MKVIKQILFNLSSIMLATLMLGCGGEADYSLEDVNPTFHGKFIDNAVEGLEYRRSNGDTGVTLKGGRYSYKRGDFLSFHVGALDLGESESGSVITPRELAQGVDIIEDPSVNNRVRLMLALDSNDQRIGIQIDEATRSSATLWKQTIDFSKSESAFITEVNTVTNGEITQLPTASEANTHFAKSLRCAYSGAYQGAWDVPDSNESSGYVGVMIQANGFVVVMGDGQTVNGQDNSVIYVLGDHDINTRSYTFRNDGFYYYNRSGSELTLVTNGVVISGEGVNTAYDKIRGSFVNGSESGNYSVTRADASSNAAYRFTGFGDDMTGMTIGMIIMDIDPNGKISGLIHDVRDTSIQPQLYGTANFLTGEVNIVVDMPAQVSIVSGTINFNDTSIPSELVWENEAGTVTYGKVRLDGCQLQAID